MDALAPALTPFTFHWYEGVSPPLEGTAWQFTRLPEQNGLGAAEMLTKAVRLLSTVIVKALLVAGLFDVQAVYEEVSTQLTTSLFTGVYEKVDEFAPEFTPFTFHW